MLVFIYRDKNIYRIRQVDRQACTCIVCLFVLRLNVPVSNFSVMSGRSHRFLGN